MNTKVLKRAALTAGAGAMALAALAPGAALAQYRTTPSYGQAYDQQGQYYYDGCARSEANRAVVGGLIGAVAGAAIGNNTGSPRRNDENALIGGLLGAAAGASIGKGTAACTPESRVYNSYSYGPSYDYGYNAPYNYGYGYGYDYTPPPPPPPTRAPQYGYGYGSGYDYGYGNRYGPNCQLIEDTVRLPDGRTQRRLVQACRDSSGRYQIVQ